MRGKKTKSPKQKMRKAPRASVKGRATKPARTESPAKKTATKRESTRKVQARQKQPHSIPSDLMPPKVEKNTEPAPRAPLRKIIGPGKTIKIVTDSNDVVGSGQDQIQPAKIVSEVVTPARIPIVTCKIAWDMLPANYPPHMRYILKKALEQCLSAADSPFPFGKFIAILPVETNAEGIALLFLSRTERPQAVSEICGIDLEQAEAILQETLSIIEERFSAMCGEMSRKWKAQAVGSGVTLEALIERYLLPKIDREFQFLIGELLLYAIGAGHILRKVHSEPANWQPKAFNSR